MSQIGCFSRFIGFSFLVALLVVGGFVAYQAGIAQGIAQAPDVVKAIAPVSNPSGFLEGIGSLSFFNFFGAVCTSIFFIFLFFGLVRFLSCAVRFGREGQTPNSDFSKAI